MLQPIAIEERGVGMYSLSDFIERHIFIGSVRACRVARSELQRGEWHQRLVAERG